MFLLQFYIPLIIQFDILIHSIIQNQLRCLYYDNSLQKAIEVVSTTNMTLDVIHVLQFDRVRFNGII